jgi:hypothetical protein
MRGIKTPFADASSAYNLSVDDVRQEGVTGEPRSLAEAVVRVQVPWIAVEVVPFLSTICNCPLANSLFPSMFK